MLTPDSFAGKLFLWLGALAMGLLVGSITTTVHQNTVDVAGVEIPWGLILGLAAVAGFLVGLRLLVDNRWIVSLAAIGVVSMVFLLSQESPGGSILVPNNLWGTIWALAPTIVAIVVIAWPKIPVRT